MKQEWEVAGRNINCIGNRRASCGFTLLELLVVLVIIALLSAFVGPKIASGLSGMHLKTAAARTSAVLRYARNRSASAQVLVNCIFDLDHNRLKVASVMPDQGVENPSNMKEHNTFMVTSYDLPEGISFKKVINSREEKDTGSCAISFYSNGCSGGGRVVLQDEKKHVLAIDIDYILGTVILGDD